MAFSFFQRDSKSISVERIDENQLAIRKLEKNRSLSKIISYVKISREDGSWKSEANASYRTTQIGTSHCITSYRGRKDLMASDMLVFCMRNRRFQAKCQRHKVIIEQKAITSEDTHICMIELTLLRVVCKTKIRRLFFSVTWATDFRLF